MLTPHVLDASVYMVIRLRPCVTSRTPLVLGAPLPHPSAQVEIYVIVDEVPVVGTSASTRTSISATATVDASSAMNTLVRRTACMIKFFCLSSKEPCSLPFTRKLFEVKPAPLVVRAGELGANLRRTTQSSRNHYVCVSFEVRVG